MNSGNFFVMSAPSGAGKTTLGRRLLDRVPSLEYSVSYTTRSPRPGEVDGHDYHFVSPDGFQEMIDQNALLEWAVVFENRYGTGRKWVEDRLSQGRNVLADVDIEGARQIKSNFPEAILVFILPPTLRELENRLRGRRTESDTQLATRLGRIREEIQAGEFYDYLVINDDLEKAVEDLVALIRAEGLRARLWDSFWPRFFA